MLKILQARFQQYVNREHVVVQAGFSKGRITRDQIANIHWIIEKAKEFQENICLIDHTKIIPFFVWITTNGEKFFKRWECQITLPASWETCVQVKKHRDRCGTMDWFKIGKGVCQGYVLSPCLFNLHAEYIMQNARLDNSQAGIKIALRNINNLRYADDIMFFICHKTLWQKVKRNYKASW